MKAAIEKIMVMERIRKEISRIPELAADIEKNGLLHPVTVMAVDGGGLRLLAGLRRIKAAQELGWAEIDVKVVSPADAEAALSIEFSENEQREPFTYSEKMDYARLFEDIERAKAQERMMSGKSAEIPDPVDHGPQGREHRGKSRDAIGEKIGMSGKQYDRAKYIADKATPEMIEQLDKGERSIRGTYDELRAKEDDDELPLPESLPEASPEAPSTKQGKAKPAGSGYRFASDGMTDEELMDAMNWSEKEKEMAREASRRQREFDAMTPDEKIADLQRQLRDERARAAGAESELSTLKLNHGIAVDHKDSIIEYLKMKNAELGEALAAANRRIAELEAGSSGAGAYSQ